MEISDLDAAAACLERIGYYRLSGYWFPFRRSSVYNDSQTGRLRLQVEDQFRPGTTFLQVMDLYAFDKRLRLILLDAIERVEVALRVDIALLLGAKSPWAHRDPNNLHGKFAKRIDLQTGKPRHSKWLERIDEGFAKSKEEFVKHFKAKYQGDPPIWIAIELWDFGTLSVIIEGLQKADQDQLSAKYGLPRSELLATLTRNINNIRNICAHHSRLWNRSPADQAAPPRVGEVPLLDHVATDTNAQARIYSTIAALQFLLKTINPTTTWGVRLKTLIETFPNVGGVAIVQAGFPNNWASQQLWS